MCLLLVVRMVMLFPFISDVRTLLILGMHVQVHQIKEIIYYVEVTPTFSTEELFNATYKFHLFSFSRFSCSAVPLHLKNLLMKF